ncbi:MAG: hypothetical protein Q7J35_16775 [Candidatus Methanoperedens sp.]|nr:hypothetical protein [Candidatus Methanoperedens sp.]
MANKNENRDVLFQTSTIDALLEGVYDGDITFVGKLFQQITLASNWYELKTNSDCLEKSANP